MHLAAARRWWPAWVLSLAVALLAAPVPRAQDAAPADEGAPQVRAPLPRGKKIILTDGSYQLAREYTREGERVRYYSVERSQWEELPASLVDWEATERATQEYEHEQQAATERARVTAVAGRLAGLDIDTSLEVGPGTFLPDEEGLYAFDGESVMEMAQSDAEISLNKGRAILKVITGMPMIDTKHTVELPGEHSPIRLSEDVEFYFRGVDGREARFMLVRADVKGDKRDLQTMSTDIAGQVSYESDEIPLLVWNVAGKVYRYSPNQRLAPGEYALIERTSEGISLYVWDFGVDVPRGR